MGGGEIIASFLDAQAIDEFVISVVPVFIGDGIPLIARRHRHVPLHLQSVERLTMALVQLHCHVRTQMILPTNLEPVEVRVIGSLIEKELSTPDNYPLSLNALTSACNQSSNRDPVMSLEEGTVMQAIDTLRRQGLVRSIQAIGSRVPKYQHLLAETDELTRAELAVLCVLALRGPQTQAEVRTRAARLMPGDDSSGMTPRSKR